ncbi:forkhead box protein J1 [Microcaecilia unicolor]|uniref:Forkhead box protein J1 n=1 Tax=Microcaecilia unicolor TaxID=1415580 RepID=A0A6P7YLT2_9AMPH|nr:forkhead box protein J1 [Microcaecilia unicolor]XP_030064075.1 forkhead box protein J1 [Microcaecilia unicolor]
MLDLPIVATPDMAECWQSLQVEGEDVQETIMGDSVNLDDSLTSLQWLQEFSIINANVNKSSTSANASDPHGYNKIPGSAAPCSPLAADPACMGMPHTPGKPISSSTSRTAHLGVGIQAQPMEDIDYKTNPRIKPPYSYATLICMAMQASKKTKITLSAIYKWITDNFCYFRHADPTWQNSIRHNLSLNKCFIKVPREKDEPGKGGFWKIDPQYADRLMNGAIKKRRLPPVQIHPAFTNGLGLPSNSVAASEQNTSPWINGGVLNISMETQELLREFEEATNAQNWNPAEGKATHKRKQTLPKRVCKAPRLSSSPMLTHEEQTELGPLKGDFDWEAIFETTLNDSLSAFDDLEMTPPVSPITRAMDLTVHGKHIDCPQEWCPVGQDQVLTESNQNNLDIDETFLATSFLQHPWEEERNDYLSNSVNLDQLFELNDAFPTDLNEWAPMGSFL